MDDHKLKMERRSTHGKGVSNRQFGHWPGNRTDENERSDYQCMSQLSSPHCRSSTSMNGFDGRSEPIVTLERVREAILMCSQLNHCRPRSRGEVKYTVGR
jgi:hypothetical protein